MHIDSNNLHPNECHCFRWKPVFAGALVAIGLSFLLNLFSVAIGMTAFTTNSEGVQNLAMGGLVATALGTVVSMFAAGWVAGYLAKRYCAKRHLGALYGFLAWCLALVIMVFLAEHITSYIDLYTHFLSGTPVRAMTAAAAETANNPPMENKVVISTYIVFCLFFLGAFASSLGGHCGMRHVCKDEMMTH